MREIFSLLIFLIAIASDWLAVTRIAAFFTDFDYRYWPLARGRQIGMIAILAAAISTWVAGPEGPIWLEIVATALLAVWAVTAWIDVKAQRRTGYRSPSRYSDTIDC